MLVEDTVRRFVFNKAGDEDSTVWEAGYFNDRDRDFHEMFDRHLDELIAAFTNGRRAPDPCPSRAKSAATGACVDRIVRERWPGDDRLDGTADRLPQCDKPPPAAGADVQKTPALRQDIGLLWLP